MGPGMATEVGNTVMMHLKHKNYTYSPTHPCMYRGFNVVFHPQGGPTSNPHYVGAGGGGGGGGGALY